MIRINLFILFILGFTLLSSCRAPSEIKESEFVNFGEKGLRQDEIYTFYPFETMTDSLTNDLFSIYICARYTENCKLSSLPIKIEYASLVNDSIKERWIDIPLYNDRGKFSGKGNLGIYESDFLFLKEQPYEDGLFISICTSTPDSKGIVSLGVISKLCYETNSK